MALVRPLTEKSEIRAILNRDRAWALYALADLDDTLFSDCEWWGAGGGLALVYHGIAIRPVFVTGTLAETEALLDGLPVESGYLNLRMEFLGAAQGRFVYRQRNEMLRMMLGEFAPCEGPTVALTRADQAEVAALFATGTGSGIAFAPFQMESGLFRGVRAEDGALVAVAGVHVFSEAESVAGVGNVFVREDYRGRRLAQRVLSATVAATRGRGIQTIGLNVDHTNVAGIRAYERLGFRTAFRYCEGTAELVGR